MMAHPLKLNSEGTKKKSKMYIQITRVSLFLVMLLLLSCTEEEIRTKQNFCEGWKFTLTDQDNYRDPGFDASSWRQLKLPHDWSIEGEFSEDHPSTEGGGALPGDCAAGPPLTV